MKVFLIFLLFLTSCSPATRLANLLRKNPELIKSDTVFSNTASPPVIIHDSIPFTYTPIINTDSLIELKADSLGYIRKEDCKQVAQTTYTKKVVIFPTDTFDISGVTDSGAIYSGKAWFAGKSLKYDMKVVPDSVRVPTYISNVQPPKALNFFERNIWLPLGKFFSILLLLIIIYVVVRVGFKVKIPFLP